MQFLNGPRPCWGTLNGSGLRIDELIVSETITPAAAVDAPAWHRCVCRRLLAGAGKSTHGDALFDFFQATPPDHSHGALTVSAGRSNSFGRFAWPAVCAAGPVRMGSPAVRHEREHSSASVQAKAQSWRTLDEPRSQQGGAVPRGTVRATERRVPPLLSTAYELGAFAKFGEGLWVKLNHTGGDRGRAVHEGIAGPLEAIPCLSSCRAKRSCWLTYTRGLKREVRTDA